MRHNSNQSTRPGFLVLNYLELRCRMLHNGWSEPRPAASEAVQAQDPGALSNLSPISPASMLFDTEGSLTDVSESGAEDADGAFVKTGKLVRAAASGLLPRLDTSDHALNTKIDQGVWVPLSGESSRCIGYYAQVSIYNTDSGRWFSPLCLHIDTAGRNTWGFGEGYRVRDEKGMLVPFSKLSQVENRPFHTTIGKKRHDFDAAEVLSGAEEFADGCYASMFLASKHPEQFRLTQWFEYSAEHSWLSPYIGSYHFGIADEIDRNTHRLRFDGAIGLGLQPFQYAFASSKVNLANIPSFIAAIKNGLPVVDMDSEGGGEGGHVLYFCLRRVDIPGGAPNNVPGGVLSSKSWLSINNWPCKAAPAWSLRIPLCSSEPTINEYLWKAELISIAFGPHDGSQPQLHFKFPNGPIHVLFDTGSTGSWFPSALVRYLRTTVFPIPENMQIDAERGSSSSIKNPSRKPDYYIPSDINTIQWVVKLEFTGVGGMPLVIMCPGYPFLGCEPVGEVVRTGYKEGLLFSAAEKNSRFILGANFFQSMLVALHAPEFSDPYVRVAWPRTVDGVFVPPPIRGMRQ